MCRVTLIRHYIIESAAGTFSYLKASARPKLKSTLAADDELPLDLSEAFLNSMESLMLAQAQECVWQWAVMGAVTIRISVGLLLAPLLRSQFKWDHSEACRAGGSRWLHVVRFYSVFRHRSCMMLQDWRFGTPFHPSRTRYHLLVVLWYPLPETPTQRCPSRSGRSTPRSNTFISVPRLSIASRLTTLSATSQCLGSIDITFASFDTYASGMGTRSPVLPLRNLRQKGHLTWHAAERLN